MPLSFGDETYQTISDVTKKFKTSVKTIKKAVSSGDLPEPDIITRGKKRFRHYDESWMEKAEVFFK